MKCVIMERNYYSWIRHKTLTFTIDTRCKHRSLLARRVNT